ncbi:MAG TPA: hypothetical protein VHC63_00575 [Acidimicrobiales bacterium]|nr:hypothetical protein [Acidimicrobiales bacterium]
MASLSERVGATRLLLPLVVGAAGSAGVAVAHHNPDKGPAVVAVASLVAVVAAVFDERGVAVAALGVGAAGAFPVPAGLAPLLVATGTIVSTEIGLVARGLARWRVLLDALVCVPAAAGLAGTVAAQPSERGEVLAGAAVVALAATLWRNRTVPLVVTAGSPVAYLGAVAAVALALAPDRIHALGDLPPATITAARSLAAGLGVFVLAVVADVLWAEGRAAPGVSRR